jgi:pyruvate dehydrogenase E1 component beta subunit
LENTFTPTSEQPARWVTNLSGAPPVAPATGREKVPYVQAIREGFEAAIEAFPGAVLMGQGIDDPYSMFGTTTGLAARFGRERVFDTPVAEESMTGISVGAAMNGLRPVLMHNRPDFILLSFNQVVNHASKMRYMDNGRSSVPLVIWAAIGRGWGCGSQHSQAIQGLLLGVPGLKIVMPSTPADSKGLLLSAIADDNPVVFLEHRWVMRGAGPVPEGDYRVPLGRACYRERGSDLTIVGASHALTLALDALRLLEKSGRKVSADVIDLRTIKPLDEEAILDSVSRTGRLLVVDTGWAMGGVCAEIGCLAAEKAFHRLKAPVRRVGLPDIPTPAGFALEKLYYPDAERISAAVLEALR